MKCNCLFGFRVQSTVVELDVVVVQHSSLIPPNKMSCRKNNQENFVRQFTLRPVQRGFTMGSVVRRGRIHGSENIAAYDVDGSSAISVTHALTLVVMLLITFDTIAYKHFLNRNYIQAADFAFV